MSVDDTDFNSLPGRLLLDTSILNLLQDEGEYIFEGYLPPGVNEQDLDKDLIALRRIFQVNQRAAFQFFVSPLTFAELANEKDMIRSQRRVDHLEEQAQSFHTTGKVVPTAANMRTVRLLRYMWCIEEGS